MVEETMLSTVVSCPLPGGRVSSYSGIVMVQYSDLTSCRLRSSRVVTLTV